MTSEFEHRISVVIPTYNRAQTIMRAINSVLGQTLSAFEIIVVDDGSFDGTKDVLKAHSFFSKNAKVPQKKYFVQKNGGVSSARNLGIRKANGDFIAFLDSDDAWRLAAHETVLFVPEFLTIKYGGHSDQLSRAYWGMDRFRVRSLEKLIHSGSITHSQRELVIKTLIQKLNILETGARKREKFNAAKEYRDRKIRWEGEKQFAN